MLVLGNGTFAQRGETLAPQIAQSGFTAGFWVYPNSDGWLSALDDGAFSLGSDGWFTGYARIHSLMGQFHSDAGWMMGVSGSLAAATPVSDSRHGGLPQLSAFLMADASAGTPPPIDTPIESGRYTHLTMSYRYVDGTSNELVLYKDGRVAASGVTPQEIVLGGAANNSPLNIGGVTDGSHATDKFKFAGGWDHLVSGAYHFRRVLNEGEILDLHEAGGLQPDVELRNDTKEVLITDNSLIAYVEGKAPGWVDSSKNHYSFVAERDPGVPGFYYTWDPGPFGTNRAFNDSTTSVPISISAPSGATFDLATAAGGFTIVGSFSPSLSTLRQDGMMFSVGSISTDATGPANPSTVTAGTTMGMDLTYFQEAGFGDRIALELFPLGDDRDALVLRASGEQVYSSTNLHLGIVYDASTQGIALYLDGYENTSGTLQHNLQDQLLRIAGSGFPLMFGNGIANDIGDLTAKGLSIRGGLGGSVGTVGLFSRPLGPGEMRALAQSGINTLDLDQTKNDPRLMGYWPCDTVDNSHAVVEDKARAMSPLLGHLSRGESSTKWARVYDTSNDQYRDDGTSRVDLFGVPTLPPELSGFGNLGITSGIFSPQGGSPFGGGLSANLDSRNTPFNAIARWRPATEDRELSPQSTNEYVLSYEVTPSGDIPNLDASYHESSNTPSLFNSNLHVYGNLGLGLGTSEGEVSSFLTSHDSEASGIKLCFVSLDGISSVVPIISGTLPYGVPSRVLFHAKFDDPYNINDFTVGNSLMTVSLWINGQKVNQRTDTATNWQLWSEQPVEGTSSDWPLQFGGYATLDSATASIGSDGGLGEIYMRNIFLMRGVFDDGEIQSLASNGIQSSFPTGFDGSIPTTTVKVNDANLEGYWRFNGFDGNVGQMSNSPGGSGTTDLSSKGNHLDAIAQRVYEDGTNVQMMRNTRAISGPLAGSSLGIQSSGFHILGVRPTDGNYMPPFAVSGAAFDTPAAGFSVGFLMARRSAVGTTAFGAVLAYGHMTSSANGDVAAVDRDPNRGWVIGMDDTEQMKMVISTGGNLYLDGVANAAQSGQVVCGMTNTGNPLSDLRDYNNYEHGDYRIPGLDYWDHYCWVYSPTPEASGIRCYLNGAKVDDRVFPSGLSPWIEGGDAGPQTPAEPTARMLTFRSHQKSGGASWDFGQQDLIDYDSVFTDVFYFSRPLTEPEVRYIAFDGIGSVTGTVTSGIVGGFAYGQDTGSGLVGGQVYGQDTGSGLVGGQALGAILSSGLIGGFVSGIVVANGLIGGQAYGQDTGSGLLGGFAYGADIGSGLIGAYAQGQDTVSGIMGGHAYGAELGSGFVGGQVLGVGLASGIVGGFVLGGLSGSVFFDATYALTAEAIQEFDGLVHVTTTDSSDFDAKVIVFQSECPPVVTIPTPFGVSGLAVPFSQYFVGEITPQQGKTITQAKWNFSDFTGDFVVSASGSNSYPMSHTFSQSGFYIARLSAVDSDGVHGSTTVFVNAASGINPVIISLSGVPQIGEASLDVDFVTTVDTIPTGVIISANLLTFDDGQSTISNSPSHSYTEPGKYTPIWCVRDSRGVIWCDSLRPGNDEGNL
jgi:hypothetical protein